MGSVGSGWGLVGLHGLEVMNRLVALPADTGPQLHVLGLHSALELSHHSSSMTHHQREVLRLERALVITVADLHGILPKPSESAVDEQPRRW